MSYLANLLIESAAVVDTCLVSADTIERIAHDNGLLIEAQPERMFVTYRGVTFYAILPAVSA